MMEQVKRELQDGGDPLVFQTRLADAAPINTSSPGQRSLPCPGGITELPGCPWMNSLHTRMHPCCGP